MKKILPWLIAALVLVTALAAAAWNLLQDSREEEGYRLYYLSEEEDQLIVLRHEAEESDATALAAELYLLQQTLPEENNKNVVLLLPENVSLLNLTVEEELLTVSFSAEYYDMSTEREILVRAGLVRLFTQISEVKQVEIQVEGEPLTDSSGTEIGAMTADRFVENSGKEVNSYQRASMTLYFANSDQTLLLPEQRSVYYNSNIPLERAVVEQLISGPKEEGSLAVLPTDLNVLSVTIQDEICYVNLDNSFTSLLELPSSALNPELAVYSIVTSLAETCNVDKVQISVNGQTDLTVGSVDLNGVLTVREDLIYQEEE